MQFHTSTFGMLRRVLRRQITTLPYHGPAFAFDIDGVLIRGRQVIPAGRAALRSLFDSSSNSWRAPIAFLTNGGGTTEAVRAELLSSMLEVPVQEHHVILAHTPMRQLVDLYRHNAVLTVGPPQCADVARSYGFPNVIDTETLSSLERTATPYARIDHVRPSHEDRRVAKMQISAIFVMADTNDWGRDIQLLLDVLRSDGNCDRVHCDQQVVDLYFCNPDILFPNEYHLPRLAGGSFSIALQAVYKHVTGQSLRFVQFGKPYAPNYQLAEKVLQNQLHNWGYDTDLLPAIYAIGDNPASDVRGANSRGHPWRSVLVRTGNFKGDNDDVDTAHVVVDDVEHAVNFALNAH